jgi:hypothetical protein
VRFVVENNVRASADVLGTRTWANHRGGPSLLGSSGVPKHLEEAELLLQVLVEGTQLTVVALLADFIIVQDESPPRYYKPRPALSVEGATMCSSGSFRVGARQNMQ